MSRVLRESELEFRFPGESRPWKFDDPATHGLSSMKAVDFVVELPDHDLFVEVKDPDQSGATEARRQQFGEKLRSGRLIHDLALKYRDTWLYRHGHGSSLRAVRYLALIQWSRLDEALMSNLTDKLRKELPMRGPGGRAWANPLATDAMVINVAGWNRLRRYGSVRRNAPPTSASTRRSKGGPR